LIPHVRESCRRRLLVGIYEQDVRSGDGVHDGEVRRDG
jgi:hypothetical protein